MPCCWHPCPSCWSIAWTEAPCAFTTRARRPESWSKPAACWQEKRYASVHMTQVKRKKTGETDLRGLFEGGGGGILEGFFFSNLNESRFILWWLTFFGGELSDIFSDWIWNPPPKRWQKISFQQGQDSSLTYELYGVEASQIAYTNVFSQTFCPIQL